MVSLRYFFVSLQFERVCVRGTLARVTPLAFRSWPRPRNSASATATQDFHFGISISFCKIAARTNPRPFHFVYASPREHPAVPYFAPHAVAVKRFRTRQQRGGITSGYLSNCFLRCQTIADFNGVVQPCAGLISSVSSCVGRLQSTRETHRLP